GTGHAESGQRQQDLAAGTAEEGVPGHGSSHCQMVSRAQIATRMAKAPSQPRRLRATCNHPTVKPTRDSDYSGRQPSPAAGAGLKAGAGGAAARSRTAVLIASAYCVMCQLRASVAARPWNVLSAVDGSLTPMVNHVVSAPPAAASDPAGRPLPTLG